MRSRGETPLSDGAGANRMGRLRGLTTRFNQHPEVIESDRMRRESSEPGVVDIADVVPRQLATVRGEIRSVTLRPRVDVPALDVELWDGTDALHLVWLGRRRIPGITPGIRLRATGRVTKQRAVTTIFNPSYEVIGKATGAHG